MIQIKSLSGIVIREVDADNFQGADLWGANLRGADLEGADLRGAYLLRANLLRANLLRADLRGADLQGADLRGADLQGADLQGAIMPDERTFEQWVKDPLDGICKEEDVRNRAIAAWGNHQWTNCPMHSAFGWEGFEDVPENIAKKVATFVALFDGGLLPEPGK